MRKNNKSAAKIFTFLLCLTLLAGCSSTGNETGKDNTQVTTTEAPDNGGSGSEGNSGSSTGDNTSTDDKSSGGSTDEGKAGSTDTDKSSGDEGSKGGSTGDASDPGSSQESVNANVPESAKFKTISIDYKTKDLETSFVPGDCTSIVFSEGDVKVNGKDTEISNVNGRQIVKIIKKGDYLISGECSNGQIIVEANKEKDVRLILNGVKLACPDSAPIYEKQCDKMIITLADGTENELSSNLEYVYDNTEKKQPDAVIFAKDDLVINGNGSLMVDTSFSEGIHSTDSVKIISGTIVIDSGDNGIRGKEAVIIKDGKISIVSRGDAIRTTYSDNTSLGYVIIEGGSIATKSMKDGIQATGHIQITGGTFDIYTDNGIAHADSGEDGKSAKGIKTDNDIYIKDASITINSVDDAINNNGNLIIDGGSLSLSALDDAIHTDGNIVVNGGSVTIEQSKEGLEGKSVSVNGGSVTVKASDDGIKATARDDDDSDSKVVFGDANAFAAPEDVYVAVTGGNVSIVTDGDFIDSNGNLYITGGSIVLDGTKASEDGGVSCKGVAHIFGGSIEANGVGDIKDKILNKTE